MTMCSSNTGTGDDDDRRGAATSSHDNGNGNSNSNRSAPPVAVTSAFSSTISCPTFPEDRPNKIIVDVANLNVEDIQALKKSDPFLYFSIPAVYKAAVYNREIDLSTLQDSHSSRVERHSRISFECHPDLLMEEFTEDLAGPGLSLSNLNDLDLDLDLDEIMACLNLNSSVKQ